MQYISDEQYEIGLKNGLNKPMMYHRVYKYGWNVQDAITKPPMPVEERSRKHPKEIVDLALSNGISLITFYARLKYGWSYEEASTIKLKTRRKRG